MSWSDLCRSVLNPVEPRHPCFVLEHLHQGQILWYATLWDTQSDSER